MSMPAKIFDIKPAWVRRFFLIILFGWVTFIVMFVMWFILGIALIAYEGYRTFMWWAVDYVKNVWDGESRPDKYKPFDNG